MNASVRLMLVAVLFAATGLAGEVKTNTTGQFSNQFWDVMPITVTNIHATAISQVVTNVEFGSNGRGCPTCEKLRKSSDGGTTVLLYHPPHNAEPWKDADEKWAVTNVVKRVVVGFDWMGTTIVHTNETVLHTTTNRWRLRTEWHPVN